MPDAIIRLQKRGQMVIPRSLREQAGVGEGTLLKVAVVKGGQLLLTPQVTVDRPSAKTARSHRADAHSELAQVVDEIRREARDKGLDKISLKEIDRAGS